MSEHRSIPDTNIVPICGIIEYTKSKIIETNHDNIQ